MKYISQAFYYLFVLLIVLIGLGLISTQTSLLGSYEIRIVQSGSMEPALMTGGLILIHPEERYYVNDIITYGENKRRRDIPTTHRIVDERISDGQLAYVTKGDANESEDGTLVTDRDILGKVVFHVPYLGFVIDFARTPLGFVAMIVIPASLVILDEGVNIYNEIKARRKEKEPKEE
jgi:signal peptidase